VKGRWALEKRELSPSPPDPVGESVQRVLLTPVASAGPMRCKIWDVVALL
jgi:hypothetical protein